MKKKAKVNKKTNSIALLAPFFYNPFVSEIVDGIENKLVGTEFNPVQYSTKGNLSNERNIFQKILKLNLADAFILFNIPVDKDIRIELKIKKIPVISLEMEIPEFTCITSDNFKGGYKGTEYLIKKGYRKIALVIGKRYIPDITQNERIKGYMAALNDNKIEFNDEFIKEVVQHNYEAGIQISKEFYKEKKYDAIFCLQGDIVAAGIIKGLRDNNVNVPQDIAVIGYDDLKIAEYLKPALTTIRQHTKKMGELAVELLLDFFEGKKERLEKKIIIAPELVIRESA